MSRASYDLVGCRNETEVGTGWEPQGLCRLSVGFFMNQWQAYRVATGNLPSNTITALKIDDVGRMASLDRHQRQ
ncbi:MAG: hypothetical protein R2867_18370 [Caldilineaceae bacterium]